MGNFEFQRPSNVIKRREKFDRVVKLNVHFLPRINQLKRVNEFIRCHRNKHAAVVSNFNSIEIHAVTHSVPPGNANGEERHTPPSRTANGALSLSLSLFLSKPRQLIYARPIRRTLQRAKPLVAVSRLGSTIKGEFTRFATANQPVMIVPMRRDA